MEIGYQAISIESGIYDNDKKLLPEPNNLKVPHYCDQICIFFSRLNSQISLKRHNT